MTEQNRKESLIADINKQADLGFSLEEIRQNLENNGYTPEEIRQVGLVAYQNKVAEKDKKFSPWSLLISLFFIIRGIMYFAKEQHTMGFLMVGLGFLGFILKAVNLRSSK